jgi:hypothetical protein
MSQLGAHCLDSHKWQIIFLNMGLLYYLVKTGSHDLDLMDCFEFHATQVHLRQSDDFIE